MKQLLNIIHFVFITLVFTSTIYSQQDSLGLELVRLELKDGSTIIGYIIQEDENSILMKTLSDLEIKVPVDKIIEKNMITGQIEKGEFWHRDPNQTRMFFTTTGKALKQGEGYFAVYEIFFPFIAVGVTDWFTLAGGMTLVPGAENQIFYFAPKITPLHIQNFDASLGVLYLAVPDSKGGGIAYGVATYGTEKASITSGVGYGFSGDDFADKPVIVLGGDIRISKSFKLLTENWIIIDGDISFFSFGLRIFGESLAADFGMVFSSEGGDGFPFLPWVGFAYNF